MQNQNNNFCIHCVPKQFQLAVLNWYKKHGRCDLPWQINISPYRVMVSEIMLQQTQVATVIPYFHRFMKRFPTPIALAKADDNEVMHYWAGLGYYRRARHLHQAAKLIATQFQGIVPNDLHTLMTLPGIGKSTAGAILAIGYKEPAAILDGNVKRVLSRYFAIATPINDSKTIHLLWEIAEQLIPRRSQQIRDYTQAMMDLGALICTRHHPICNHCPLQTTCLSYQTQQTAVIPRKKPSAKLPVVKKTFLIVQLNQQIFLEKRPLDGVWGGLYSFPEFEGQPNEDKINEFKRAFFDRKMKWEYQELRMLKHSFTHFHLLIHPAVLRARRKRWPRKVIANKNQIWYNLDEVPKVGLPKPVQSLITIIQRGEDEHTPRSLY